MFHRILIAPFALALALTGCDVDQTQEGRLPEVEVRGGQLPRFDVDTAEIDVHTEQRRVEVPDVDVEVHRRETTVTVPAVDVRMPD
ncbi:MAG: hypothetical protein H6721_14825 [Sandaracinus sp.]|nr:hypothetical protein [Sandaracinus sp.]MCB9633386.1 hypothetical protein [Sandaracinus sp.]